MKEFVKQPRFSGSLVCRYSRFAGYLMLAMNGTYLFFVQMKRHQGHHAKQHFKTYVS
jgi:hypothetical protein